MSPVVGVDLGGTKVAIAALGDSALGDSAIEPTELSSGTALVEQIVRMVRTAGEELEAVGIGVPSVVEFETGTVVSSVNVPLVDVPLRRVLGDRLGVPVFVDNDATVAALAEAHDANMRMVARNLVMLTFGTGVGGGLVLGGRIYRGATGAAGELGHTLVGLAVEREVPAASGFPQPGSLESLASGQALDRLAVAVASECPESELGLLAARGAQCTGVEAVRAAQEGDEPARHAVRLWAQRVGIGIANAINTFDPEDVVIGGGAARAGELLLEPATRIAHEYALPGLGTRTRIRLAWHGVRAGVLGAALLAAHELEAPTSHATIEVG